jgi:hypothetical protein
MVSLALLSTRLKRLVAFAESGIMQRRAQRHLSRHSRTHSFERSLLQQSN